MQVPRFVCFDTETTGFKDDARILELGLVFWQEGEITSRIRFRFFPKDLDWEDEQVKQALSVNGLSKEELEGSPEFADEVQSITRLLSQYDVWVAHNLDFDMRMLEGEFARCDLPLPLPERLVPVCTLRLARTFDRAKTNKLADVAARYEVPLTNAHTALADAEAAAHIFTKMAAKDRLTKDMREGIIAVLVAEAAA